MRRLDRFMLKSFIGPFVAILAVVVFVLILQFLWLYIDELVGKGLGLSVILEFLFWGACTTLPLSLPLATLLSSMMVIGQLGENNELLAIKAAGVPFYRIIAPLIVTAFGISVGAYFIGDRLVPQAYNEIFTLRDDIGKTKNEIKIPSGIFYDGIEGYVLRVNDQNKETGMFYGVMVFDHTGGKGNSAMTIADSATLKLSKRKDYLTFTLYNGTNYQEDNTTTYRDTSLALQHINFSRQEMIISLQNYSFEKSDTSRYDDQAKSRSSKDLIVNSKELHHEVDSIAIQHISILKRFAVFEHSNQLDSAFRSQGLSPFQADSLGRWNKYEDRIKAYSGALEKARSYNGDISSLKYASYEQRYYLRHYDIEILKKIAQALACFLLFFIGAPLGSIIRKGGLGTSAIVSALFFVLYWVVDISGTKLATDGAVSAARGAFISSIVLAPIGAFLTWKAITETSLVNTDLIKMWFRKVFSKIRGFFHPIRIVYMGTPEFAVAPLDNLIKNGYKVVGIVTTADKPSGRGLKLNECAVKKYAVEHNIPVLQPLKLKDPEFLKALEAWKADLFVVVAFRMLPEEVWKMPRLGTFNLHAALLPQYRGAAPINWAIINGEKRTGVTTFMLDKNIDTGAILLRQDCIIEPNDNAGTLHDKLMAIGSELVVQSVEGIIQKNIETRVQRSFIQGSEQLKSAPKLTRETCHINWNDTSSNIINLIRGLSPYPTAYTDLVDSNSGTSSLKIFAAHSLESSEVAKYLSEIESLRGNQSAEIVSVADVNLLAPGTILTDGKTYFAIATADGAIAIDDMQVAGKKRMEVKSFLAGFRNNYICCK